MKLMFCHVCSTLVVPDHNANVARFCNCGTCAVWWVSPASGDIGCYSTSPKHVSLLGLNNALLTEPYDASREGDGTEYGFIHKQQLDRLTEECPKDYLFHTVRSNILRFRPDFHGIRGLTFVNDIKLVPNANRDSQSKDTSPG